MKYKILIVDDEPANLRMLERLFREKCDVVTAASGPEALVALSQHDAAVIVSDQRMPEMTGIEFLQRAAEMRPQTVRIILTGYTDVNDLVTAINSGVVYKYITKPWVNADLMQTVDRAVEHYEATKNHHILALENHRLSTRMQVSVDRLVNVVCEVLSQKNYSLAQHSRRTANYAEQIAEKLGLDNADASRTP
jgi:response regulator RpfG family c-di-GMP phosphodiesterase